MAAMRGLLVGRAVVFGLNARNGVTQTNLDARELLGEIDQAIARDEALEAWFLMTTRIVPEQLLQDLTKKGEGCSVPVAETPLAELFNYVSALRSLSRDEQASRWRSRAMRHCR